MRLDSKSRHEGMRQNELLCTTMQCDTMDAPPDMPPEAGYANLGAMSGYAINVCVQINAHEWPARC